MPATTITLEFDPVVGSAPDAFAITALPTLSALGGARRHVSEQIQFGFADATASGTAKLNTSVGVELVDPDASGRLTGAELSLLDVEDVVALHLSATAPDDVDIDLALTAEAAGTQFGGTLSVSDVSLFADPPKRHASARSAPTRSTSCEHQRRVRHDLAHAAHLELGTSMSGGDVKLPFLADGVFIPGDLGDDAQAGFDRVFKVIQPIVDYVEPRRPARSSAARSCPTRRARTRTACRSDRSATSTSGDVVYCRTSRPTRAPAGTWNV